MIEFWTSGPQIHVQNISVNSSALYRVLETLGNQVQVTVHYGNPMYFSKIKFNPLLAVMNHLSRSKCVPENYFWCSSKIEQKSPDIFFFFFSILTLTRVSADCFHLEAQNSEPLQNLLQLMTTWKIVLLSGSSWCLSSSILWLQSHFKFFLYKKELQIGNIDSPQYEII